MDSDYIDPEEHAYWSHFRPEESEQTMADNTGLHYVGGFEPTEEARAAFITGYMTAMHLIGGAFLLGSPQPSESPIAKRVNRHLIQTHLQQARDAWDGLVAISEQGNRKESWLKLFNEGDVN